MKLANFGHLPRSWSAHASHGWLELAASGCKKAWRRAIGTIACCGLGTRAKAVPHPVDSATLPRGRVRLGDGGFEAFTVFSRKSVLDDFPLIVSQSVTTFCAPPPLRTYRVR